IPRRRGDADEVNAQFFFSSRRRHTSSKRDWSSDVCSSDLSVTAADISEALAPQGFKIDKRQVQLAEPIRIIGESQVTIKVFRDEIGRASCRERVATAVVDAT